MMNIISQNNKDEDKIMTENMAEQMPGKNISGANQLKLQTADALEEAARRLRSADVSMNDEEVRNILHGIHDKVEHVKEELGTRYHELEIDYHQRVEPVENIICDHPIPAVLVALGVGVLCGMLISKFRD
jgi:ElaB/YqjD/DUF883 family membrane-anchored ribosome-binding protein